MLEEGEVEGQRFTREENLYLFLRKSDIPIIRDVATFLQKKNENFSSLFLFFLFLSLHPPSPLLSSGSYYVVEAGCKLKTRLPQFCPVCWDY